MEANCRKNQNCGFMAAYSQLYITEKLWWYQFVKYNGKIYSCTMLGFGHNVAPKIMAAVLKTVVRKNKVKEATDPYIDDIIIDLTENLRDENAILLMQRELGEGCVV